MERLLQPDAPVAFERRQAERRSLDVIAPDLAGVDQQDAVLAKALARRVEMVGVVLDATRSRTVPSRT